jgi:hypothetical protein
MKYFVPFLLIACTDDKETATDCETTIEDGVPEFYQQYFACVDISMNGDAVVISSDGLPPHQSYYYGEGNTNYTDFDTSGDRSTYSPNPNVISEQNLSIEIPAEPTSSGLTIDDTLVDGDVTTADNQYGMGTVGLALDGVSIFNSLAAPGDVIENEVSTFDSYNAHPEMSGNYHYHTDSSGPLEILEGKGYTANTTPGQADLEVYGIMCDGTVILGCTELDGSTPDNVDFDSQNGHVHDLVDVDGTSHFTNRYHIHICTGTFTDFLYTPEIQYYDQCK